MFVCRRVKGIFKGRQTESKRRVSIPFLDHSRFTVPAFRYELIGSLEGFD